MFDFGLRLRELRIKHKMSQEELGRRVERSKSVISSYENNLKAPPLNILCDIASIFNVSLDWLVGIDKDEMVSVEQLTAKQKDIIDLLIFEFCNQSKAADGLSSRQQEILSAIMKEFSKTIK